jgi:hypothetical protein
MRQRREKSLLVAAVAFLSLGAIVGVILTQFVLDAMRYGIGHGG